MHIRAAVYGPVRNPLVDLLAAVAEIIRPLSNRILIAVNPCQGRRRDPPLISNDPGVGDWIERETDGGGEGKGRRRRKRRRRRRIAELTDLSIVLSLVRRWRGRLSGGGAKGGGGEELRVGPRNVTRFQ